MYADFGYMEEGKLGKAYDLRLIGRLAPFVKPYWKLMGLSLLLVLIMAGLDLLVPYLVKEAIDRHILNFAAEVVIRGEGSSPLERRFLDRYGKDLVGRKEKGVFLLPAQRMQGLDPKEARLLQESKILTGNRYYLFKPEHARVEEIVEGNPGLFERNGPFVFVPLDRMKALKKEDLLVLRAADVRGVLLLTMLVVLILILNFGFNYFQIYAMELSGQRMVHDLRMALFSHLQSLSISFFDRNPVGRLVTRLTNDIQNVHEMFTSVLIHLLKDIVLLVGILIAVFHFHPGLSWISLSFLPLILVTTFFFSRQAREAFREIRSKLAQMNASLQENLAGIRVVQLFQREKENEKRFGRINEGYYLANLKQISIYALFVPLIEVLSSAAIGLILWYGGGKVVQEAMSVGVLVAFLSYMRMFFQPVRDLSEKYNILQSAIASLERIFSLFDVNEKVSEPRVSRSDPIEGRIEFHRVSFSYNGEEQVLRDVTFSVRAGETVAIVGATGAGKTSLLHLLERFYDGEEGTILVDGVPIRERSLSDLRSRLGLVMQDTFLFAGTIEENICLGGRPGDGERVREVARAVKADTFIRRLPEGYQTRVGEGGRELSAGEKQLLAFARALYVDPTILILDEATSHVDPQTERLIQEGLERLLKGRTALVIAHRFSTIQHADRIVVLHNWGLRELGTICVVMAKWGLYYRLYQLQFDLGQSPYAIRSDGPRNFEDRG
jgi:ABC-type multidrug transport system fused ATPase/permease subunit